MTRTQKALTVGGVVALAAASVAAVSFMVVGVRPVAESTGLRVRAKTLVSAGRYREAETCLRRAIRLTPRSSDCHYDLGNVLFLVTRTQEAIQESDAVIRLRPTHPYVYMLQAKCWVKLGDAKKAVTICEGAVDRKPYDPERRSVLGWALLEARDYREAEAQLKQAVGQRPDMANAWMWLGAAQMGLKHAGDAAGSYRHALRLEPESEHAHLGLGMALRRAGDKQGAREHLQRAIARAKDTGNRAQAREELDQLK